MASEILAQLDKDLEGIAWLKLLQDKTGVPRLYIALGGAAVIFFMILFGYLDCLLTSLVGFLYPAYASFKAIESVDKADDTQWLTYWVVFAFFSVIEYFAQYLLHVFPLYYV